MANLSRRQFLRLSGGALGAAASLTLPPALRRAAAAPAASGSLQDVQHVVFFMQENRSFDHYYGMLRGVRGFADPNAHTLSTGNSVFYQPNDTNPLGYTLPFQLSAANGLCVPDMAHSWTSMHQSWNDGKLDDFLGAEGKTSGAHTMGYYTRAELRFHYELADAYTICDHYFGSVLGPTNPNRLYSMTGTIDPEGKAGGPVTDNSEAGYSWTTYPERLQAAGITWRNYQNTSDNYDDNALAWFTQYRQAPQSSPLYQHGMSSVTINGTHEDQFIRDVATDSLPQVSWIIPSARYSEHPGESYSIAAGEDLARKYLEAIAANPTVYNKTVFIYTFDESGGFFDHVPPPIAPLGTPGEYINDTPIGLGFRVPTIIVSPWTRGGYVCSDVFDHTSLLRFLEARFGVEEPNISAWRRATCGDLTSAFDFTAPDASFPTLPDTTELAAQACTAYTPHPPVEQTMPVQETGTRPRRGNSA